MTFYKKSLGNKPRSRLGGLSSDLSPDVEQRARAVVDQSILPSASPTPRLLDADISDTSRNSGKRDKSDVSHNMGGDDSRETSRTVSLQVMVPEYVDEALRKHLRRGVTMRRLILDAVSEKYGIPIDAADLEDGRKGRVRKS